MKLPALYLMDSIAKNVGPPYIALFTRFLERLFLQTYRQVDETVQTKMEELLGTWRTGGPNGTQLYPANNGRIQRTLEESLFGRGGQGGGIGGGGRGMLDNPHYVMSVQQRPSLAPPMECVALANDIKRVVATRQAQLYLNPHDATNQIAIEALQKVRPVYAWVAFRL
jgi:pre-mRNA cleavage complex 2 protein Pcf11